MKTISVRIPQDLYEKMEEQTENVPYRIPKSEIVRTALREHLEDDSE